MIGAHEARTALVLGGTGNMGRAVVQMLARNGYRVVFTGRNAARGENLAHEAGAKFIAADLNDREATSACIDQSLQELRRIDVFVSLAGLVLVSPLRLTSETLFREVLEVNLTSVFRWTRAAFNHMRAHGGGAIVHVVSDAALRGIHHIPVYSTAKSGLLAMSELFAAEGAACGIRVNAICPGATVPGVQATIVGREGDAENHLDWGAAPSGRHGLPSDIAKAVLWLVSDEATHVSGATLRVDGAASAAMRGGTRE